MPTRTRTLRLLFAGHLAALLFGLGGLLIALPHPELWAGSALAGEVFRFGMNYAGSLHIWLGAATMLVFGGTFIGWRRTLIFFGVTVALSLSSELIGTGTGWPFGNYAYTGGLGYKILGRVPYTIPLSWFYVGFASYLLANRFGSRLGGRQALWAIAGGAYLLTVWDLVLDPAMAHASLPIQFWTWSETGPYFGMPVRNFVGWAVTGVLFMALSRWLWRGDADARRYPQGLPFGIYLANMAFATALSLSVGLWEPAIAAVLAGCLPAALAWRARLTESGADTEGVNIDAAQAPPGRDIAGVVMAAGARLLLRRNVDPDLQGLEHLPARGPALIAARHVHHLYDGCALTVAADRPVRIVVGLDWVRGALTRRIMERACAAAGWPVVLRPENLHRQGERSAYRPAEAGPYLRRAVRDAVALLRWGELLVVFPEAYPNHDPSYTPKLAGDDYLPFRPGFTRLVELAQRDGATRVPIVPVGLSYQRAGRRWRVRVRFGPPIELNGRADRSRVALLVEEQVRRLSQPGSVTSETEAMASSPARPREVVQS